MNKNIASIEFCILYSCEVNITHYYQNSMYLGVSPHAHQVKKLVFPKTKNDPNPYKEMYRYKTFVLGILQNISLMDIGSCQMSIKLMNTYS